MPTCRSAQQLLSHQWRFLKDKSSHHICPLTAFDGFHAAKVFPINPASADKPHAAPLTTLHGHLSESFSKPPRNNGNYETTSSFTSDIARLILYMIQEILYIIFHVLCIPNKEHHHRWWVNLKPFLPIDLAKFPQYIASTSEKNVPQ